MTYEQRKEQVKSYLGRTVTVKIDRPIGSIHPKHSDIIYSINYGYIPDVLGGDGEELDVYVLGVDMPLDEFTGRIIGIIHRENDVEDKLVAAPEGMTFYQNEIAEAVHFQEQYYNTTVEAIYQKSCGAKKIHFTHIPL
jgi:inorganic pyrophosphatase